METKKEIKNVEDAYCEHCRDLEPYTTTVVGEYGIGYCLDCEISNGGYYPEEVLKELYKKEKKLKILYFEKRIEQLKNS